MDIKNALQSWCPASFGRQSMKVIRNSSLRIAAILGDRLFQGVRFEGELLSLTPSRVNAVLKYGQPDILLVESVIRSSDGFWNTSASAEPEQQETLARVVKTARAIKVPTVFWLTVGQEKFEEYRRTADLFDLIACADPRLVDHLVNEGRNAVYLPPCVQTAIFNPFRHLDDQGELDLNILFDKGTDLLEFDAVRSAVEGLDGHGLTILESRPSQDGGSRSVSGMAQDNLPFAFVTPEARLAVLKNAKAYVSCGSSTSTWVEQQWMALEAAACRMAVVHLGRLEANDLLSDVVIDCSCEEEFLLEFYRHSKDSLYRERIAHLSWRHVNEHHTFSHRIAQLCRKLGLTHDWVEYPKVSVITPTYRRALLKRCVENYEAFDYPNKELVIVFNGNELPDASELGVSERNDITVAYVPGDLFAGAALNMGHLAASGKYVFRVDDDDHYGPNYLKDMAFSARALNADLFGKTPAPLNFEGGGDAIYVKEGSKEFVIVELSSIHDGKVWLGGNTVAGQAEFLKSNPYIDHAYGAADSSMQLNIVSSDTPCIALMDKFNVVAFRYADITLHTWKDEADKLKKNRLILAGKGEYFV
jgi:hypothetical protein